MVAVLLGYNPERWFQLICGTMVPFVKGQERMSAVEPAAAELGRSRPLRVDAARNRERILEAAENLLASDGVSVPVDAVAQRAGVGVGTLYRHFPTKEALLEAIWVSRMERLVDEARSRAGADDPGEALHDFLADMVEQGTRKKDLADALSRAGIDLEEAAAPHRDAVIDAVRELLERAQRAGAVRADIGMPELFGLVAGTCMVAEQRFAGACTAERMLSIVWDGLCAGGTDAREG